MVFFSRGLEVKGFALLVVGFVNGVFVGGVEEDDKVRCSFRSWSADAANSSALIKGTL